MKKITKHKYYSRNTGGYDPRKNSAITNGELFTFDIQIKRKNGKIYAREISNARTAFSRISESVRDDTQSNISLLKSHLISEVLQELERGFNKSKNPIGGNKSESTDDTTSKLKDIDQKSSLSRNINNQDDDFYTRIKNIQDNFEVEMERSAEKIKKLDERRKQLEDSLKKMDERKEEREKQHKIFMENSKKKLEECDKKSAILLQLKDMFLRGDNSDKKEALINELEKLGVEGIEVLRETDFSDTKDKSLIKKHIH